MCDEFIHAGLIEDTRLSRRSFGLVTAAAAAVSTTAFAQAKAVEKDVAVKTPDGTCDAVLFYPEGQGTWPSVLIWTDIAGLRPAFRDMGRRWRPKAMSFWCRTRSIVPRMRRLWAQSSISTTPNNVTSCSLIAPP